MKLDLLLYRLENKIRRFAIEKLMQIISVAMLIVLVADVMLQFASDGEYYGMLYDLLCFDRAKIFSGQVWRVLSFIFVYPINGNIFFNLLGIYFFYWTGSAVESYWGKARFNLYYIFGIIGTIIAGFIAGSISNVYLNLSIFLAFATMFPDTRVLIFFIIPIKVKWLGIIEGISLLFGIGWSLFIGILLRDFSMFAAIVVAILNYVLFFGRELIKRVKRAYDDYKWRRDYYKRR